MSSSLGAVNGSPCLRNTSVSFRTFFIIRESFPPVIWWCCVLLSLLSLSYYAASSCSNLYSSSAEQALIKRLFILDYSYYSSNHLKCPVFFSIPWSGAIGVNPATPFVSQKFPFMNSVQRSGCCLSVSCIVVMYRGSKMV